MSEIVIPVKVDKSGAITNIEQVNKAVQDLGKSAQDAATKTSDAQAAVGDNAKTATRTLNDIRKELKQVTQDLAGVEGGSEAFVELSAKAGSLKDELKAISEAVNANAGPALENLQASAGNLQGQLQSLDFEGATRSVKGLAGQVKSLDFNALTKGIGEFGNGLKSLGRALLTNPIFLLAAAIGGIVAATLAWRDATLSVDDALAATLKTQNDLVAARQQELTDLTGATEQLKLQGKSQREILMLQKQKTEETITELEAAIELQKQIRDQQIESARRGKEILKGIIEFTTAPIQLLLKTIDTVSAALGKSLSLREQFNDFTASLLFDPDEVAKEQEDAIKAQEDTLKTLRENRARYQNQITEIDKQAAARREQLLKEEEARILAERVKAREAFAKRLAEIEKQIQLRGLEVEAATLRVVQQSEFDKLNVKRQAAVAAEEIARQTRDAEVALAQGALDAIQALTDAFAGDSEASAKRAFAINKAASIAQAIASTYQGANAIFASAAANPATVLFPAQPFIAAGIAITTGLANVARIAKTKFGDTGAGGGGGTRPSFGGGTAAAPATGFQAFDPNLINNRPAQAPRAYVLASDVNSQVEAEEKVADRARL